MPDSNKDYNSFNIKSLCNIFAVSTFFGTTLA